MSKNALEAVVSRWLEDEEFRAQFATNPQAALVGYDLTPEEKTAIVNRDPSKVAHLGLDERLSKGMLSN